MDPRKTPFLNWRAGRLTPRRPRKVPPGIRIPHFHFTTPPPPPTAASSSSPQQSTAAQSLLLPNPQSPSSADVSRIKSTTAAESAAASSTIRKLTVKDIVSSHPELSIIPRQDGVIHVLCTICGLDLRPAVHSLQQHLKSNRHYSTNLLKQFQLKRLEKIQNVRPDQILRRQLQGNQNAPKTSNSSACASVSASSAPAFTQQQSMIEFIDVDLEESEDPPPVFIREQDVQVTLQEFDNEVEVENGIQIQSFQQKFFKDLHSKENSTESSDPDPTLNSNDNKPAATLLPIPMTHPAPTAPAQAAPAPAGQPALGAAPEFSFLIPEIPKPKKARANANGKRKKPPPSPASTSTSASSSPSPGAPPPQNPTVGSHLVELKWHLFTPNFSSMLFSFRNIGLFIDVQLLCEGQLIQCHKIVLASGSWYFERLLTTPPLLANPRPILYLGDLRLQDVCPIIDFMYTGEISVPYHSVNRVMSAARDLEVKGLWLRDDLTRFPETSVSFTPNPNPSEGQQP